MSQKKDKVGQALLLLIGGALMFGGGSCAVSIGANVFALFGLSIVVLGAWIIHLALKDDAADVHQHDKSQGTEKENQ